MKLRGNGYSVSFIIIVLLIALILAFFLSGCGTTGVNNQGAIVQRILDEILPPNFTGKVFIYHKNPWLDGTIEASGVKKVDGFWSFDWFTYKRQGRVSQGDIRLGNIPAGGDPTSAQEYTRGYLDALKRTGTVPSP